MPDGNSPFSGGSGPTWNDAMLAAGLHRLQHSGFGAIAYSTQTGRYGWSYGAADQPTAERIALTNCAAVDAFIVAWAHHSHLAFAIGDNGGYGYAWATKAAEAGRQAITNCSNQTTNCRLVVLVDTNQKTAVNPGRASGRRHRHRRS